MKKLFFTLLLALISITSVNAQTKMGHVNSQKVLDTIPSRKAAIAEISYIEQSGIKDLTALDSTLQVKYAEYQAKEKTWTELVRQSEMRKIQELQARIQSTEQNIDRELQALSADLNKKSLDMVKKAVNTVSAAKKLNYVIDESVLLYNSGGIDITNEVITEILKLDAANKPAGN
jgi:outer membrane protein